MIPKNIKKDDIINAIREVDLNGVPNNRQSTKYRLMYNGRTYPPKYLVSIANKYVNGNVLEPYEFSGGKESNEFLMSLGFEIKKYNDKSIDNKQSTILIGTCCIESYKSINNTKRENLLLQLIELLNDKLDLLLLPAGFFEFDYKPNDINDLFVNEIQEYLRLLDSKMVVCYGIDGRSNTDQIGVAINKEGLLSAGRKFYHTDNSIQLADNYKSKELGKERIFQIENKKFYIAICYDGFRIRKENLKNPGVDVILNLVHGFNPSGEGGSGDVYFARHSFAGASKQWGCPIFGAAVFERRVISKNWPTGVLWNQGDKSTQNWSYNKNPMTPINEISFSGKDEKALIRIYSI